MNLFTDLLDAIMIAFGLKTISVDGGTDGNVVLETKHVTYGLLGGAVAGWIGGVYRAKTKPTVNALGL